MSSASLGAAGALATAPLMKGRPPARTAGREPASARTPAAAAS
ncbi:hypothetical protein [Streptomyces sp. NPDC088762]